MIALQADLRCAPKFSACAPKNVQSGATVLLVKIVSLEPWVDSQFILYKALSQQ